MSDRYNDDTRQHLYESVFPNGMFKGVYIEPDRESQECVGLQLGSTVYHIDLDSAMTLGTGLLRASFEMYSLAMNSPDLDEMPHEFKVIGGVTYQMLLRIITDIEETRELIKDIEENSDNFQFEVYSADPDDQSTENNLDALIEQLQLIRMEHNEQIDFGENN